MFCERENCEDSNCVETPLPKHPDGPGDAPDSMELRELEILDDKGPETARSAPGEEFSSKTMKWTPVAPHDGKADTGKLRIDLIPWRILQEVARVFDYGAKKYSDEGWKKLPNLRRRYFGAALRHVMAWKLGEERDAESGLPHLAHAIVSLMYILGHEIGHDPDLEEK